MSIDQTAEIAALKQRIEALEARVPSSGKMTITHVETPPLPIAMVARPVAAYCSEMRRLGYPQKGLDMIQDNIDQRLFSLMLGVFLDATEAKGGRRDPSGVRAWIAAKFMELYPEEVAA